MMPTSFLKHTQTVADATPRSPVSRPASQQQLRTVPLPGKDKPSTETRIKQLVGCLLVFAAAICFYLSTATIRWARSQVDLAPAFFVFVRFLLGFAVVCVSMGLQGRKPVPKRYGLLFGRAVANTVAVYCFYTAVQKTSLAEANILNMTYPVFVVIFSWIFLKQQRDKVMAIGALVAFAGIYLVLAKGALAFSAYHAWGLCSGIFASFAVLFLNVSRRYHDTPTILFYLFGLGVIFTYTLFYKSIHWPTSLECFYLVLCSILAIAGQYCITYGYRFVTAVEGSIISSSRILVAAALGPIIAGDPALTGHGWIGAGLVFGVNVILALRKAKR